MPRQTDFIVDWDGPELVAATLKAAERAVDQVTNAAADSARADSPVDTEITKGGIDTEPAKLEGSSVVGAFGFDKSIGRRVIVEFVHPSKAGFMRRAGDREFPRLIGLIRLIKDGLR